MSNTLGLLWIWNHEVSIRLSAFLVVFALVGWSQRLAPRRRQAVPRARRWLSNLSLAGLNSLLLQLLFGAGAVGTAYAAGEHRWGLLNNLALPQPVIVAASVILLDLTVYLQHVSFHAVPALWRFHMVHHADIDFDLTTGIRFHPVEMILSLLLKITVVAALGPPAGAVLMFEVLLNATSMFNHGNLQLPRALDQVFRWVVVTPDMHRVHHSVDLAEANSNFGFNLPWWDRLFGTYRAQPAAGHEAMRIGLRQFEGIREQTLFWMLLLPLRTATSGELQLLGRPVSDAEMRHGTERTRR